MVRVHVFDKSGQLVPVEQPKVVKTDAEWQKHTLCSVDEAGNTKIDYRPVHMYTLTDDVAVVPPKKRVY